MLYLELAFSSVASEVLDIQDIGIITVPRWGRVLKYLLSLGFMRIESNFGYVS